MLDFSWNKKLCTVNECLFFIVDLKNNKDEIQFHDNIYSVLITILYF